MSSALKPVFRLNPKAQAEWRAAVEQLAKVARKEDPAGIQKLVTLSARRFVKNVVAVTPPSSGEASKDAKAAGEATILSDLLKIALPVTTDTLSPARARKVLGDSEALLALYTQARAGSTDGRIKPNNRELAFFPDAEFTKALKTIQKQVGFLAAGLNAAAAKLGFSLPAWIKRHGAKYGSITVTPSVTGLRIQIIQDVPFSDNIKDYSRRWNFALLKEINTLRAQGKALVTKGAKKAGFRLK